MRFFVLRLLMFDGDLMSQLFYYDRLFSWAFFRIGCFLTRFTECLQKIETCERFCFHDNPIFYYIFLQSLVCGSHYSLHLVFIVYQARY